MRRSVPILVLLAGLALCPAVFADDSQIPAAHNPNSKFYGAKGNAAGSMLSAIRVNVYRQFKFPQGQTPPRPASVASKKKQNEE